MGLKHKHQEVIFQKIEEGLKLKGLNDTQDRDCYVITNSIGCFKIFKHHIIKNDQNVQVFMHKKDDYEYLNMIEFDDNYSVSIRNLIQNELDILNKPMIDKDNQKVEEYLELL